MHSKLHTATSSKNNLFLDIGIKANWTKTQYCNSLYYFHSIAFVLGFAMLAALMGQLHWNSALARAKMIIAFAYNMEMCKHNL